MRQDQEETFIRLDTRVTVVWYAGRNGFLWHATSDGLHAVCSPAILVDPERNPYPSTYDRSDDTMTCLRCQERAARQKAPLDRAKTY